MHVAKVGVLYQAKGQTDEDALYCNSTGSSDYECFLKWLGDRVQLTGYTGYRGGLDVKKGNTGSETIVARFTLEAEPSSGLAVAPLPPDTKLGDGAYKNSDGAVGRHSEIMFHVSTLLPTSKTDEQQLNKKCHIGNDNIVIIFSESADCQVTARTMKSKMLMMVINVWPAAIYSPDTPPESRRFCFQAMLRRGLDASKPYFSSAPEGLPLDDKLHRFFIEKLLLARLGYWQVPELNVKLQHMRRDGLQRIANMIAGKPLY